MISHSAPSTSSFTTSRPGPSSLASSAPCACRSRAPAACDRCTRPGRQRAAAVIHGCSWMCRVASPSSAATAARVVIHLWGPGRSDWRPRQESEVLAIPARARHSVSRRIAAHDPRSSPCAPGVHDDRGPIIGRVDAVEEDLGEDAPVDLDGPAPRPLKAPGSERPRPVASPAESSRAPDPEQPQPRAGADVLESTPATRSAASRPPGCSTPAPRRTRTTHPAASRCVAGAVRDQLELEQAECPCHAGHLAQKPRSPDAEPWAAR